jgi:arylsulfatase A-like enzyme
MGRLVITLFLAILMAAPLTAADPPKYNVLFLMADDLRPELGCYGNTLIKTPHIDGLAKAGVRFDRAYVQFPLCCPSRSSMLTSRYPTVTGVLDNRTWFGADHPDFVSLPRHFKDNGCPTLRCGKIFHGGIDDFDAWTEGGQKRGFDGKTSNPPANPNQAMMSDKAVVLEGDGEKHLDYKTADAAIAFLKSYKEKPFFLACGFTKPHSPPSAPKKFFDMYDPSKIPLPADFQSKPTVPEGFPKLSVPAKNSDLFIDREAKPDDAREMIRAYHASLTWTDWNVGRVLTVLDELKLRDKTIIVFWGDHGYHLGEKGKWSKHGSLWEIGTRVPLIVSAPGAKLNGKECPRVVESMDIYPTLVELCGLPAAKGLQGRSLVPLLNNADAKWEDRAFTVIGANNKPNGVSVRTDRFRYAEFGPDGNGGAMMFDHTTDPGETKNIVNDEKFAKDKKTLAEMVQKFRDGKLP